MPFRIDHAKVGDWCAAYDGPPFMACLCDPPYEIGFMSKKWDATGVAFRPETWAAIGEHLLPGAFLMAFGGSRTFHRLTCAIEDAGYIIHPAICWLYGQGFPKSTRIDTQIDKAKRRDYVLAALKLGLQIPGNNLHDWTKAEHSPSDAWWEKFKGVLSSEEWRSIEREVVGERTTGIGTGNGTTPIIGDGDRTITAPATPLAAAWAGHRYGLQALKPAAEFICVAQKPYAGRPVDSITTTGAGALWVDGGRIGTDESTSRPVGAKKYDGWGLTGTGAVTGGGPGRWPANLALDSVAAEALGRQSGERKSAHYKTPADMRQVCDNPARSTWKTPPRVGTGYEDEGTAARFFFQADWSAEIEEQINSASPMFYCAKASRKERDAGLDSIEHVLYNEAQEGTLPWANTDQSQAIPAEQDTQPQRDITASPSGTPKPSQAEMFLPTSGYGSRHTDPCQPDTECTTGTSISKITGSTILNSLTPQLTNDCTQDVSPGTVSGGSHANDVGNSSSLIPNTGTCQKKAGRSMGAAKSAISGKLSTISVHVKSGGKQPRLDIEHRDGNRLHARNNHPCVKPISLARWLATLLLPPAEYAPRRILVPFAGSGSEMIGAGLAGWEDIVGIEQDADNCEIARARLTYWLDPLQAMKGD